MQHSSCRISDASSSFARSASIPRPRTELLYIKQNTTTMQQICQVDIELIINHDILSETRHWQNFCLIWGVKQPMKKKKGD